MVLPFFYTPHCDPHAGEIVLGEDNSRHIVQVLRMAAGEELHLTDGKGTLMTATLVDAHKKKSRAAVKFSAVFPAPELAVTIAISPLKNASRFEWFLEKATEIGVSGIIPLMTQRTERQHLRADRLQNILVSAMLQSQQTWLPVLLEPTSFNEVIGAPGENGVIDGLGEGRRMIAWLGEQDKAVYPTPKPGSTLILIGPEGDFTTAEVKAALDSDFVPVTLGTNRLRTETAGIVAATLLCIG